MKKAYELSILCNCKISVTIVDEFNNYYQYVTSEEDKTLLQHANNTSSELLTNTIFIEVNTFYFYC